MTNQMQAWWKNSLFDAGSQAYLEDIYEQYLQSAESVSPQWRNFFEKLDDNKSQISHLQIKEKFKNISSQPCVSPNESKNLDSEHEAIQSAVHDLINAYRLLGHLKADINPLGREIYKVPELELSYYNLHDISNEQIFNVKDMPQSSANFTEILQSLEKIYCDKIASEFMHIPDAQERIWLQQQIETRFINKELTTREKNHIFDRVVAADGLEKYLAAKYPGAKRFGLEGCDTLMVALDTLVKNSGSNSNSIEEIVISMAHRGRLNVLVNLLGKSPGELFDEFEGKINEALESGDVKYHQGFSADVETEHGHIHLSLAFNPSHLEIVNPVASGSVRARQERRKDLARKQVLAVAIHGDAAFSGQGVVMETMNMAQTNGYCIGGTIHIIVNNQIGFTTSEAQEQRSTLYCSDIGKMLMIPIFHVNADCPESVYFATKLAIDYKNKFQKDVIIDLIGYRRLGHNEADEPAATQPLMYQAIKKHPKVVDIFATKLIMQKDLTDESYADKVKKYRDLLEQRSDIVAKYITDKKHLTAADWQPYLVKDYTNEVSTKLELQTLVDLANKRDFIPEDFALHSRVQKIIEDRVKMTKGDLAIDWGYAETLAYASLLAEGYAVRVSGQDCARGTFFHRHAVWHNQQDGTTYTSLANLSDTQGQFTIINSLLSEEAVLGFEYGFSTSEPKALVIWEGQFGDFVNGAQVIIDQFITSGEQKWGRLSALTLLLPHGQEGQGPEHSSARLERFLQACANNNIQVCVPTTPAQVYHMLRRQIKRPLRKPLVVMTPKSLLRHKKAVSNLEILAKGSFQLVIADRNAVHDKVQRVVLCSGKVYYDLDEYRQEHKHDTVAIIRIEQLYPFPQKEVVDILARYVNAREVVWCQEEPKNQGAWNTMLHYLNECIQAEQVLIYVGRAASASPAVGYNKLHNTQQQQLIIDAIGKNES